MKNIRLGFHDRRWDEGRINPEGTSIYNRSIKRIILTYSVVAVRAFGMALSPS
jgi:hypothetical protein